MDPKRERAKWRRDFKKLGRERVRHLVGIGGMAGGQRKNDAAVDWLRDQDKAAEGRDKWIFAVVVFSAIVGFITLLAMFG
jgi:hypothetical protein